MRIHAIHNSKCGDYVSALTECGNWISVWCRWNVNAHALIAANLCCITEEVVVVDEEEKKVAEKTDNLKVEVDDATNELFKGMNFDMFK